MNRTLKALSVGATAILFLMLLMGALVTNTGSADGCGASWPLCKGTFMPQWDYEAIIEFSHRAVSGLGGLLVLIIAAWVWRAFQEQRALRAVSLGALALVVLQGALGAMAVIWPQPKAVLALHFGISLLCFAAVLLTAVLLFRLDRPRAQRSLPPLDPRLAFWIWWVSGFSYGVIYLGAYVRHVRASAACQGWPLCNGQLIPTLYGAVGANFIHRVGAALLALLVVRLFFMTRRLAADRPDLRTGANLALLFIVLQVATGALMPLGFLNLLTQMIHTAVITCYWGAISFLCLQALPERRLHLQTDAPTGT